MTSSQKKLLSHSKHVDSTKRSLYGLQIAAAVAERLQEKQGDEARFPALLNLGRGINQALPTLRHSIRHCIEVHLCSDASASAYLASCKAAAI